VTPERVADLDALLAELGTRVALSADDIAQFRVELTRKRRFEDVVLRTNLDAEEVARFSIDRHRFPGVKVAADLARYYPHGALTAHVVGYIGRIDETELQIIDPSNYAATKFIGKLGIEQSYESALHGRVGHQQVEVNAVGRVIRVLERTDPQPGEDLYLTLDLGLQSEATAALGTQRGAVVMLDVATGGVLALATAPSFDPNLFIGGIRAGVYRQLRNSPERPLFNRALQGQYPPGSTVKPFVGLGGLHYGVRDVESGVWCPGWYSLPGKEHRYRDWRKEGHGHVNLRRSISESCDVYYYRLAQDLGIGRLHAFLTRFGLGSKTGIDLPGESAGLVPSAPWKQAQRKEPWYLGETLIAGIGQGFMLATPVQLATAASALARRGGYLVPHLGGQLENSISGESREVTVREVPMGIAIDPAHWDAVIAGMHDVVQGVAGTARRVGESAPYRFAGKTGTSQLFGIKQNVRMKEEDIATHLRDHALFIAFAPLEQPEIAVAVLIENGGGGSRAAAPVARRVMDRYFGSRTFTAQSHETR
jgi:penicillin-binding protein 2